MSTKRKRSSSLFNEAMQALCDVCTSMTGSRQGLGALTSSDGYKHHARPELELSASQGCPICLMLLGKALGQWSASSRWDPSIVALDEHGLPIITRAGDFGFGDQKLDCLRYKRRAENDTIVFDVYVSAGKDDPASRYVANQSFATDAGGTQITRNIQERFKHCEEHEYCPANDVPLLPTRVIYVGESSEEIRLYESKAEERDNYVALSYCWGGRQALATRLENIEQNIKAVDVSSLPRTIHDAILTTRRLGFEYLWVDALCIIQDSDEDRIREIQQMGDVYKNATLTIVAANSNSVTNGFLNPLPSPATCQLPLLTPAGSTGIISLIPKLYGLQPREPLYTRAWALQEFLLSPRLLIFGAHEVIWQCYELITPVPSSHRSYDPDWPCKRIPIIHNNRSSPMSAASTDDEKLIRVRGKIWQSIVQDYTSRSLSVPEDRLPALGGIARELGKAWGHTYIAGMWRNDLLSWLLWRSKPKIPGPAEVRDETKSWRAPSWSWASVDGAVTFHWSVGTELFLSANIIDVDEKPQLIGEVIGQRLFLEAAVVPLKSLHGVREVYKEGVSRRNVAAEDGENIEDDGTLKFALLGFNYVSAFGLIVRPTGEDKDKFGTFVRVGMLCTWLPKEPSWWPKKKRRIIIM